jgi:hypothetical protein
MGWRPPGDRMPTTFVRSGPQGQKSSDTKQDQTGTRSLVASEAGDILKKAVRPKIKRNMHRICRSCGGICVYKAYRHV